MATRSQQFKAKTEHDAATARTAARTAAAEAAAAAVAVTEATEPSGHAEKKAIYAHEEGVALDHRSRKSTRKSANHAKTDSTMVHAAQMKQSAPQQSFQRSEAKASRVRGGGGSHAPKA